MVNGYAVSQRRDYLANEADFILVFERLRSSLSRFAVSMSWRSKYLPSSRNNFQPPVLDSELLMGLSRKGRNVVIIYVVKM